MLSSEKRNLTFLDSLGAKASMTPFITPESKFNTRLPQLKNSITIYPNWSTWIFIDLYLNIIKNYNEFIFLWSQMRTDKCNS